MNQKLMSYGIVTMSVRILLFSVEGRGAAKCWMDSKLMAIRFATCQEYFQECLLLYAGMRMCDVTKLLV